MEETVRSPRLIRFGTFELDVQSGELRKSGLKLKLTGLPFQVLAILLEHPGTVVTREELQKRLWPDTFVDVDHSLNTSINKIREVLGDSAESPRFVETLPRRGYRFIAPVEDNLHAQPSGPSSVGTQLPKRTWTLRLALFFGACLLLAGAAIFIYKRVHVPASTVQRALRRVTFDDGLQIGATWSPDGRFLAYSSNRGGKFDIWVQQISGGDPVQITKGVGQNWQPDWSPDGRLIAYRSEEGDGGLYIVPALGGAGLERRIAPFGYYPRWSPNASQILFQTTQLAGLNRIYVVGIDGSAPREIAAEFSSQNQRGIMWHRTLSVAWHPDGKRASMWFMENRPSPSFWTVPIEGGTAVESAIPPDVAKQLGDVASGRQEWWLDSKFSWAPSGKAIYFERTFRGVRNIWKMTVDPNTLEPTAIERMTTGPGLDTDLSISADGRMAFTVEAQHIRAWLFPFDANRGRVTGAGQAVTSSGVEVTGQSLTRDGKKLAFSGNRAGKWDLWEKSLADSREAPFVADDYSRAGPQWSRDGTRLAYVRFDPKSGSQLMVWSSQSRNEEPVTTSSHTYREVWDWSPDGEWLLISQGNSDTRMAEMWLLPVANRPHSEAASRRVTSNSAYNLFQAKFSPNGQWIVFEAVEQPPNPNTGSTLYVMPASGGPWTLISEGDHWDDKPRWSPDGNTIYFVSNRRGFFNVWGIRFDATQGKPVGEPFRVTTFEDPAQMLPRQITKVELSLTQDQLLLTLEDLSGSIWVLDNVDR